MDLINVTAGVHCMIYVLQLILDSYLFYPITLNVCVYRIVIQKSSHNL